MNTLDEKVRSDALQRYDILNTPPEPNFDRITRITSTVLRRSVCTLALADRDRFWFKSRHGVEATEMPRHMAFCEETISGRDVFVVDDALRDPRFAGAPVVKGAPNFRFYAGAPLITPCGVGIGSLCVLDYAPKSDFSIEERGILADLASTVVELLEGRARQIELARCTEEIAHLARHDPLTGLPNRRHLEAMHDAFQTRGGGQGVALLYLDLDGFKAVNDREGHACGDALLRQVAARIRSCVPVEACAARIGGDEFAVLLLAPLETVRAEAADLAQRLLERIRQPYKQIGSGLRIGCSVGISSSDVGTELQHMLNRADAALYRAKSEGRGRYAFADEPGPFERLALRP